MEIAMAEMAEAVPHKRHGYWYCVKRVPHHYAHLDKRSIVQISTGIRIADDPRKIRATPAVRTISARLARYWTQLRDGLDAQAIWDTEQQMQRAAAYGLPYMTSDEVAKADLPLLMHRMQFAKRQGNLDDKEHVGAVLGGDQRQPLLVSQLLKNFEEAQAVQLASKSPQQLRKWRVRMQSELDRFISVIGGDRALSMVTRKEALLYRKHWRDRIMAKEVKAASANRRMKCITATWRAVVDHHQLEIADPFIKMSFKGAEERKRPAFGEEFVQSHILAEGVFDDLNDEARHLIYLVAETGLRLSEACSLNASTIVLKHNIPHIIIDGAMANRQLKTKSSKRKIPLVGVALDVMRLHPKGFPRYHDNADSASAVINAALEARKLFPTEEHTLYSLRHTFENRLTRVRVNEKELCCLMGHDYDRAKYGDGLPLEVAYELLQGIAFKAPSRV